MKRYLPALAILSGLALAGPALAVGVESPSQALQGITVHGATPPPFATEERPLGDCTPPSDLPSCEALHRALRDAFTQTQLGMLFGAASSHVQYLTSYDSLMDRYQQFLTDYQGAIHYTPVASTDR